MAYGFCSHEIESINEVILCSGGTDSSGLLRLRQRFSGRGYSYKPCHDKGRQFHLVLNGCPQGEPCLPLEREKRSGVGCWMRVGLVGYVLSRFSGWENIGATLPSTYERFALMQEVGLGLREWILKTIPLGSDSFHL